VVYLDALSQDGDPSKNIEDTPGRSRFYFVKSYIEIFDNVYMIDRIFAMPLI